MYWFNPLVWIAAAVSKTDSEISCDAAVIREVGEENRFDYGKILVELAGTKPAAVVRKKNIACVATTMCGGKMSMMNRMKFLVSKRRMTAFTLAVMMIICAGLIGCTFTAASDKISDAESQTSDKSINMAEAGNAGLHEGEQHALVLPVSGEYKLTAVYGERTNPATGATLFHKGWDMISDNDVVYAIADGSYADGGFDAEYGNWIELEVYPEGMTDEKDEPVDPVYVFYAHMAESLLTEGKVAEGEKKEIAAGEALGTMGSTGRATGKHLHFEIRTVKGDSDSVIDPAMYFGDPEEIYGEAGNGR